MKIAALVLALSLGASTAAFADAAPPVMTKSSDVCLQVSQIDHTSVIDDRTILYYMNNRKIWKNTLNSPCSSLKFERGFSEEVRGGVICSNRQMIRVLHSGNWCSLGAFTPYTPPEKSTAN